MEERKIVVADPTPLGLFGLAMVTLVASSQKLGITEGISFVLPWAIFLGASAQLYACIQDAKKNNLFGATAFGGYAFFWYSVAFSWMIQAGIFCEHLMGTVDTKQLGIAYICYFIFVLIDVLFLGLAMSTLGIMYNPMHTVAGVAELGIAILSFYGSAAVVVNTQFKKTVLPLGEAFYKG